LLTSLGNVYIADYLNNRVRKVAISTGTIATIVGNGNTGYSGDNVEATSTSIYNSIGIALDAAGILLFTCINFAIVLLLTF
jgi:hypothetical protein